MAKIKVVQQKEKEIPAEILAKSISDISAGMAKLNSCRLTRKAIITLIQANSGVSKGNIELVLNNLDQLETTWLKPKKV